MKKETFWSLIIEPEWTQAALWEKTDDNLNIISSSKPSRYESHNLVEVVDSCLTDAISDYPEDQEEPSKTVFGVPSFWVKGGSIEKEHLERIREVCTKLSLSPTGFVVMSEAVAHSVKLLEGSPLTGIVLNLSNNFVSVSVFKLGNLVGTVNVGRSASIFEDVIEGLSRFEIKEPFPTRFLMLGGDADDVEEQSQTLIKSDWTDFGDKNLRFLHTPQFEVLAFDKKAIAISIAGASEIGSVKNVEFAGKELAEDNSPVSSHAEGSNISQTNDLSAADIGFVIDEDIAEKDGGVPQKEQELDEQVTFKRHKKIGFPKLPVFKNPLSKNIQKEKVDKPQKEFSAKISKVHALNKAKLFIGGLVTIIGVAIIAAGAAWWYLPKAEVIIYVSPKRLEADDAITLDENSANVNPDNMVFLATSVSTQVSETKQKNTTGTITVGDKASGRVTVRNGTSNPVQLSSGDSVYGPNDLEFVLVESASVSAALSPTEPGQATIEAKAAEIGAEYNIAKDEKMSVDGYSSSDVDAIVNESFSGGTSREIVAISQNDLDILESELLAELKRKGISELESKVSSGRFIPESVRTDVSDESFSGSVGDEASEVSLSLTIDVSGIYISDDTVDKLSQKLLSEQIPDGFSLRSEQIEADFQLVEVVEDGLYDFDVVLSANLLPEVNIDDIKTEIMGKYPPEAENFLSSIQGFSKAEVSLNPRFPGRLGVIPRIGKNISIEIQAER